MPRLEWNEVRKRKTRTYKVTYKVSLICFTGMILQNSPKYIEVRDGPSNLTWL